MAKNGFNVDEILYESSPAVREIAVSAIVTIQRNYPDQLHIEGNALVFDIPNSYLRVELIKDITTPIVELGCVIFDLGLTIAKIYPELAEAYMPGGINKLHQIMYEIYSKITNMKERYDVIKATFPEKSKTFAEVLQAAPLPEIADKHGAIINVLEGFYTAQQVKLEAMLRILNIPIKLIDVTFSDQGLNLSLPQEND